MSEFKLQITTKAKNAGLFILRKGKRRVRKRERKRKEFRVGPETIVQGEGDKDLERNRSVSLCLFKPFFILI